MSGQHARAVRELFDHDEVRDVLRDTFYGGPQPEESAPEPLLRPLASTDPEPTRRRGKKPKPKKPDHYDVICISLYKEDLERLDAKVAELKARGHRRMTRSALIRYALDGVDLDGVPRGL